MPLLLRIVAVLRLADALRMRRPDSTDQSAGEDSYTFENFVRDFGRTYEKGSADYGRRADVFEDSLSQIRALNSRVGRSWTAGVHPFMDWFGAERAARLHGYDPLTGTRRHTPTPETAALQTGAGSSYQTYGGADDNFEAETPAVRNQGGLCGSCWAFSAVEAVEAQLMKDSGGGTAWNWVDGEPRLSVQALLDCVPNPRHCGGNGGCGGATPELALDFMVKSGLPLEQDVPYRPTDTGRCPIEPFPSDWVRVTVGGWRSLPSNQAQPLMRALVQEGPVVVSADAHDWYPYQTGIFDGCHKDAVPNHSVLAKGYGIMENQKYWLLQNSWSLQWGEAGTIRLLRHDDEDHWCGADSRPQEGSACEDQAQGNVTVCGACGLLYDPVIPQVGQVKVQRDDGVPAPAAVTASDSSGTVAASSEANVDADVSAQMSAIAPPPPSFSQTALSLRTK